MQTAERSSAKDTSEQVIFNRCLFAYKAAGQFVKGNILELGSGEGYGINHLAPLADTYTAVDKFDSQFEALPNVKFLKMELPFLKGITDNSFDYVITFQVIEHIKDDNTFVKEIFRVLKPGGSLLLSTPNKSMSLTRNPWHVREYKDFELEKLLKTSFTNVSMKGVYGTPAYLDYYKKNKESVKKFTRFDILNLQYILPRQILQIPYNILNRINRRKLQKGNMQLVDTITVDDFFLQDKTQDCFDLFYIATK